MKRRWEYRIEAFKQPEDGLYTVTPSIPEYQAWLQGFGDDGWEVYAMFGGVVHMKREKSDLSEAEIKANASADTTFCESLQSPWFPYLWGEAVTYPNA